MRCTSVILRNRIIGVIELLVVLGLSGCAMAPLALLGTAASTGVLVSQNLPEGVEVELSAPDGGVLEPKTFMRLKTVVTDDRYVHAFLSEKKKGLFTVVKKTVKHPLTESSAAKIAKQNRVAAFLWVKEGSAGIDSGLFSGTKQVRSFVATIVDAKDRVLYKQTVTIKQKTTMFGENRTLNEEDVAKLVIDILVNDFKRGKGLAVAKAK